VNSTSFVPSPVGLPRLAPIAATSLLLLPAQVHAQDDVEVEKAGFPIYAAIVPVIVIGLVFWIFSLEPARDEEGKVKSASFSPAGENPFESPEEAERAVPGLDEPDRLESFKVRAVAFLAEKAKVEDVIKLPSGLMYKVLQKGSGTKSPGPDDTCQWHYTCRLFNGADLDSTYTRGRPTNSSPGMFAVEGCREAMQLMVEGDVWELYIPPQLAYGDSGVQGEIPPGSAITFELEMVKFGSQP